MCNTTSYNKLCCPLTPITAVMNPLLSHSRAEGLAAAAQPGGSSSSAARVATAGAGLRVLSNSVSRLEWLSWHATSGLQEGQATRRQDANKQCEP